MESDEDSTVRHCVLGAGAEKWIEGKGSVTYSWRAFKRPFKRPSMNTLQETRTFNPVSVIPWRGSEKS